MVYKNSKLKWDKKGSSDAPIEESTMLIPHTFIVIIVFVFISFVMFDYMNLKFETESLETNLLSKTLRYSPNCLAYKDDKTHPGLIDLSKVTELNLKECFSKNKLSFNVKILVNDQEIKKAELMNARDLSNFKICDNVPNAWCKTKTEPVLITDGQDTVKGLMKLEVIGYE